MKSAILSGWTGTQFAKIASYTIPLIEHYANKHGASFAAVNLAGERPPSWHKIPFVIQTLEQFDQVAWIDSDVVIERHDKSIFDEVPSDSILALVEHITECGSVPNFGIWVARKPLLPYLYDAWNSCNYINHPWWEQAAMIEKLGYEVVDVQATFKEETELYKKTTWLSSTWNHHPCDQRKVHSPRFRHITMYPNREEVVRHYAEIAEASINTKLSKPNSTTSEILTRKNISLISHFSNDYSKIITENIQKQQSETNVFTSDYSPYIFYGKNLVNVCAMDCNFRETVSQIELLPAKTIGLLGVSPILPYLKYSNKNFIVFENDPELISQCITSIDLSSIPIIFKENINEFLDSNIEAYIVYNQFSKMNPQILDAILGSKKNISKRKIKNYSSNLPKVLVQARPGLFAERGGDTIALERSNEALIDLGVKVKLDLHGHEDPSNYDIVHLYNFSTPSEIEPFARRAVDCKKPFVVTTLYEELPLFFPKMRVYGEILTQYLSGKYGNIDFSIVHDAINQALPLNQTTIYRNNDFVAEHASCLLSSGTQESIALKRNYPNAKGITIVQFGSSGLPTVSPDLFSNRYKIKDFILCVGRIEWRKNQAMLLKAFEDSDLPIVLVAGNMTYQPEYQEQVSRFKRKGRTVIVSNLSLEELASAYRAARVHVLPSWYELPGLVSLEAARSGTPVVGTRFGTLSDYLGNEALYLDPESITSIYQSTMSGYNQDRGKGSLVQQAEKFTWENTACRLLEVYDNVLNTVTKSTGPSIEQTKSSLIESWAAN
ncbi:MAG TPA: glycosyltransferase [Oligoflexia bacterium]|nr:glycosyltransferase [Oligoflexia bacterium]HMP49183.1 glycosyltransferase [Oligoflexia bacterium]